MRIYVCVKQVPDTAANITLNGPREYDNALKFVMNPFDEFAVEQALQVKEALESAEVIAVTVGGNSAEATLRTALAMGADRGILIVAEDRRLDSILTARVLHQAIAQDGSPDLIFTGKQSVDAEGMQTGYRLAAGFDMPIVNEAVRFQMNGEKVMVEREAGGGLRELIELTLPCVIGAAKGLNIPRYACLSEIMKARKKEIKVLDIRHFAPTAVGEKQELLKLCLEPEGRKVVMLRGSILEATSKLVDLLKNKEQIL